ncbi:MAG: LacI family DNA-binding transcriptional regulator [Bacillota bacterium]
MNQREIAKLAGVSSATVSRVINNDPRVSLETASQVRKIISKYGYVQNVIARNLRMASTKTIGFLIPDISNPFFSAVLTGIEAVCAKYGYNILLENTSEDFLKEQAAIDTLLKQRIDGIVAIVVDESGEQLKRFQTMNVPVVLIDRRTHYKDYDCVVIDNVGGVSSGVDYLLRLGHIKIAIIHGRKNITPGEERLQGYINTMKKAGIDINPDYVMDGNFTEEGAYSCTRELLQLSSPPTAIISANNIMTMGVYKALADMRVRIPHEISVLGFDDFPLAAYLSPPISIINRPTVEMGKIATEMLFERLHEEFTQSPREKVLPTNLIIRGSCAHPK